MFRLYKLETEKRNKLNLETIYDYLDLYNGHTGYTLLAEVKTKQEFNSTIGEFTTNWNPYRKEKNIIALVIEDMDENIIDILYETEEKTLKWAENHKDIINWSKYECGTLALEPEWVRQEKMSYEYSHTREKWTDEDLRKVKLLLKTDKTYKEVAKELGRTYYGILHLMRSGVVYGKIN